VGGAGEFATLATEAGVTLSAPEDEADGFELHAAETKSSARATGREIVIDDVTGLP